MYIDHDQPGSAVDVAATPSDAAADTPAAAGAADSPAVVDATADAGGQGEAAAPSTAAAAVATTPEGVAAAAAGATAQQVLEIEGRLDGKPYKIPGNIEIPWKRGNEQGFATLEEVRKAHMFEKDYRVRTAALGEERRAHESTKIEVEKMRRQLDVERQFVERENKRLMEALTSPDPEVRERHARHFDALQNDPAYREAYEKSLRADAYEAVQSFDTELQQQSEAQAILADIQETAGKLAEEFPGVDVQRALKRYGQDVAEGRAPLKESALRAVFKDEHEYVQRSVTPLASRLEALEAELSTLKGTKADLHNQSVRSQIAKNNAARVVPATGVGAPPNPAAAPSGKPKPRSRHEAHLAFLSQT